MNRSSFSENYPRKFATRIAKSLCKLRVPREMPHQVAEQEQLWSWTLAGSESSHERIAKRPKLGTQARLPKCRAKPIAELTWGKRAKITGKTTSLDAHQKWKGVFEKLQQEGPGVGKVHVLNPEILHELNEMIQDKKVVQVAACRGTDRTIAPIQTLLKGEVPYRRSIFMERTSGELHAEEEREMWENLAKGQLIRPSHACRMNITVFACNPSHDPTTVVSRTDNSTLPSKSVPPPMVEATMDAGPTSPNPVGDMTESQKADLEPAVQTQHFRSLPKDEQQALIRAQGFRPEVARIAWKTARSFGFQ